MKFLTAITILAITLCSCHFMNHRIKGDGNVVTQERKVSGFEGVEVSGALDVYLTQDSAATVRVEADNNLQEYIEVTVRDGRLHIRQANNTSLQPTRDIKVYVNAATCHVLHISGASSITGQNKISDPKGIELRLSGASHAALELATPNVFVDMAGASNATLSGVTKDFRLECSGASKAQAFGLLSEKAVVDVAGASHAEVFGSVSINIDASGASGVQYKGEGAVSAHTSGASSASKIQ